MIVYSLPRPAVSANHRRAVAPPFSRAIERLFDDAAERLSGARKAGATTVTPAMDVIETDTVFHVVFDVPGATREDLNVTIEGRRLDIESVVAETAVPAEAATTGTAANPAIETGTPAAVASAVAQTERVLYRERTLPRFARSVILPAEVDQSTSQARVENGVLTLTLVKKVPTGARRISIR